LKRGKVSLLIRLSLYYRGKPYKDLIEINYVLSRGLNNGLDTN